MKTNSTTVSTGGKKLKITFYAQLLTYNIISKNLKYKAEKLIFVLSVGPNQQLLKKEKKTDRILLCYHYFICLLKHFQIK